MGGRVPQRLGARIGVWSLRMVCVALAGCRTLCSGNNPTIRRPSFRRRVAFRSAPLRRRPACKGRVRDEEDRAVPGVALKIRSLSNGSSFETTTDAEGIFRLRDVPLDAYELRTVREGYEPLVVERVQVSAAGLVVLELKIKGLGTTATPPKGASGVPGGSRVPAGPTPQGSAYPGLRSPAPEKSSVHPANRIPSARVCELCTGSRPLGRRDARVAPL